MSVILPVGVAPPLEAPATVTVMLRALLATRVPEAGLTVTVAVPVAVDAGQSRPVQSDLFGIGVADADPVDADVSPDRIVEAQKQSKDRGLAGA